MRILRKFTDKFNELLRNSEYNALNAPQEEYDKIFNELGITESDYEYMLDIENQIGDNWADYDFEEIIGEKGFDAIINYNADEYVVFRPEQIKIIDKQSV
jgi:hypothetical protein